MLLLLASSRLPAGVSLVLLVTLHFADLCFAQNKGVQLVKRDVSLPVLPQAEYKALLAANPLIPRDHDQLMQMARALGGADDEGIKLIATFSGEMDTAELTTTDCGEAIYGAFFAALQNPDLDESVSATAAATADRAIPRFGRPRELGHFKFYYTTNDNNHTRHNVTDEAIQATAKVMNDAWDDFSNNFVVPKHRVEADGKRMIDVRVYDIPKLGRNGVTNSNWEHIELDSVTVVRNPCRRQTIPVHELFHRVQYTYGYNSGSPRRRWAVEATASWSQKYRSAHVEDWLDRMDSGFSSSNFDTPPYEVPLFDRGYDAISLWIYLGQRTGNEANAVRDVWSRYSANGHNMQRALSRVVLAKLPGSNIEKFLLEWHWTNLRKDLDPQQSNFDYDEDEMVISSCGITRGPLTGVTPQLHSLAADDTVGTPDSVAEFAADYHRYRIKPGVASVKLTISPANDGKVGIGVLATRENHIVREIPTSMESGVTVYNADISAIQATDLFVVVMGTFGGCDYRISAEAE